MRLLSNVVIQVCAGAEHCTPLLVSNKGTDNLAHYAGMVLELLFLEKGHEFHDDDDNYDDTVGNGRRISI